MVLLLPPVPARGTALLSPHNPLYLGTGSAVPPLTSHPQTEDTLPHQPAEQFQSTVGVAAQFDKADSMQAGLASGSQVFLHLTGLAANSHRLDFNVAELLSGLLWQHTFTCRTGDSEGR